MADYFRRGSQVSIVSLIRFPTFSCVPTPPRWKSNSSLFPLSPWRLGSVTVLAQLVPGFAGVLLEAIVTCLTTIDTEDLEATFVSSASNMIFRISNRWVKQNFKFCEDCIDGVAAEALHQILPFLDKDAFDKMMTCLGPDLPPTRLTSNNQHQQLKHNHDYNTHKNNNASHNEE